MTTSRRINDQDFTRPRASTRSQRVVLKSLVRTNSTAGTTGIRPDRRTRAREYIVRLERILEDSPHTSITLSDLAHILDMERTYCSKVFRDLSGMSFSEWIRRIRVARAKHLLRHSARTITEVGHMVGYRDITTFERNFRKELGVSPRSFRLQGAGELQIENTRPSSRLMHDG